MITLSIVYFCYTVYEFISGIKKEKKKSNRIIELLCDLVPGVALLINGLVLKGVISSDAFIFKIFGIVSIVWMLGKCIIKKRKKSEKTETDES